MTNILNKNLNFLISELKSGVDELSKAESCSFGKYLSYSRNRSFGNVAENAASNILNLHVIYHFLLFRAVPPSLLLLMIMIIELKKSQKLKKNALKKFLKGIMKKKLSMKILKGLMKKKAKLKNMKLILNCIINIMVKK